jgi:hypothetical protein
MIVSLGQEVIGTDSSLGKAEGMAMDPKSERADQMVIRPGVLSASRRLVVLGHVTEVEDGTVRVDLAQANLGELERYEPTEYLPPELSNSGPVDFDGNLRVSGGAASPDNWGRFPGQQVPQAPGTTNDEQVVPEDRRLSVVRSGMRVWDEKGDMVGKARGFSVETTTGQPTHLSLERGLLGRGELEIPLEWVEQYTPKGVLLRVTKSRVESLEKANTKRQA